MYVLKRPNVLNTGEMIQANIKGATTHGTIIRNIITTRNNGKPTNLKRVEPIKQGDLVKLMFQGIENHEIERMWVMVNN